jgi:RNA polymerase sigma-70 factor (sigma-E family)
MGTSATLRPDRVTAHGPPRDGSPLPTPGTDGVTAPPGAVPRPDPGAPATTFEAFYRDEYHNILGVVRMLTGDRTAAEDIVQESFARAYQRWATVGGYDRPGAWVRRVALNRAVSWLRRRRTERHALQRIGTRTAADPADIDTRDDALWTAVRRLPARQAQVVALVYVEDRSVADVARILGCREGSVKQHLSRARARLAVVVEDERPANLPGGRTDD